MQDIEIMPDHIHIFIKVLKPMCFQLSRFMNHLKGSFSFLVRKRFPSLRKFKAFWSPSYFVESIGHISESVVRKYIRDQTKDMKPTYRYKNMVNAVLKKARPRPTLPLNSSSVNNLIRVSSSNECNHGEKLIHLHP